jgi:hypothetical protein
LRPEVRAPRPTWAAVAGELVPMHETATGVTVSLAGVPGGRGAAGNSVPVANCRPPSPTTDVGEMSARVRDPVTRPRAAGDPGPRLRSRSSRGASPGRVEA